MCILKGVPHEEGAGEGKSSLWIISPAVSFINSSIRCGATQLIQTVNSYLSFSTGAASRPPCQYWQSTHARTMWKLNVKRKEIECKQMRIKRTDKRNDETLNHLRRTTMSFYFYF
ncbi:hypothetical protein GOODEAATRI_008638 [Goodea atripinnis]|uniref:Uncharacterized protein n=1 Tax=Goodea atripinnis TaxID=208336 RepID=A0ABV0MQG9_9TELE